MRVKKNKLSAIKRGRLSAEEKRLIEEWIEIKSDTDIARDLRRDVNQIREHKKIYLAQAPTVTVKRSEAEECRSELRARPEWRQIKEEFSDTELVYFENDYVQLRRQFQDIVHTEFKQVKHLITLDILMHRHMTERKKNQEDIERLEKLLKREYDKPENAQNIELITQLETNLQAIKAASSVKTKEYKDLQDKHQGIMRDIKGTREQRIKNLDQRGKFLEVLKMLTDEDTKRLINEEIGLYNLGVEKERQRLSQPHKYRDNQVDLPLLTPETV